MRRYFMFCQKCGAEIDDEAAVCVKCGVSVEPKTNNSELDEPKTGIGVLMGLFLGLIGLIVGLCLYKEGTIARKTFLKAWGITFGVCVAVVVLFYIITIASAVATINSMY